MFNKFYYIIPRVILFLVAYARKNNSLGAFDFGVLHSGYSNKTSKRLKYIKWTEKDRYDIDFYQKFENLLQ